MILIQEPLLIHAVQLVITLLPPPVLTLPQIHLIAAAAGIFVQEALTVVMVPVLIQILMLLIVELVLLAAIVLAHQSCHQRRLRLAVLLDARI